MIASTTFTIIFLLAIIFIADKTTATDSATAKNKTMPKSLQDSTLVENQNSAPVSFLYFSRSSRTLIGYKYTFAENIVFYYIVLTTVFFILENYNISILWESVRRLPKSICKSNRTEFGEI